MKTKRILSIFIVTAVLVILLAISAFAKQAIELKTGTRGLRTIIENAVLPVMYSAPSNKNIQKIVMDVDEKDSLKVVPTVIENPKTTEEVSA